MRCAISGSAMALENNTDKIYGFQFHPESFLTENGNLLIKKIYLCDYLTFYFLFYLIKIFPKTIFILRDLLILQT